MLKNNKILKAQMGISLPASAPGLTMSNLTGWLTAGGLAAANYARTAARTVAKVANRVPISMGTLAAIPVGLTAFAMTRPSAASGAVQIAHENQLKNEREAAIKKEQEYWDDKARYYENALSNGPFINQYGMVVTHYDPLTRTVSGYREGRNGDIAFADKNLYTGEYLNPVYKDGKTGAYYEGTLDLNYSTPHIGRGENLMPYSIIPLEKPEWVVSNPNDNLKLESIVLRKKGKKPSGSQPSEQPSSGTSSGTSESAAVNPTPSNPNPEDKSKWKQILEILKGKSNESPNTNPSTWQKMTLQDKPWKPQWYIPKAISAYFRYVAPTEAAFKAMGWMPINSGPTYQLFPSLRPTMDRIANINSQPENQTQQQENTEKEELPKVPIGYRQNSTSANLQDSTILRDNTYTW